MAIRTKTELLALFADNDAGEISAQDLRDFVDSNLALDIQTIALAFDTVNNETDLVYLSTGANVIELPDIDDFKERALIIYNDSSGVANVTAAGGQSIEGQPFRLLKAGDAITIAPQVINPINWAVVSTRLNEFIDLRDTPINYLGDGLKVVRVNAAEDGLEFAEPPTPNAYAAASEDENPLTTTIVSADTFTPINCNLSGAGNEFTAAANGVTYTGAEEKTFLFTFTASVARNSGLDQLAVKGFKNSVLPVAGRCAFNVHGQGSNDSDGVGTVSGSVTLDNGNTFEIKIANLLATTNLDVTDITLAIWEP